MRNCFLIFMIIFTLNASGSCPGMKGEELKRCECFEKLEAPEMVEQKCEQKSDCTVIHDKCGGWVTLNKKYEMKYKKLYKSPSFKSVMPEPGMICLQNKCRLRPVIRRK